MRKCLMLLYLFLCVLLFCWFGPSPPVPNLFPAFSPFFPSSVLIRIHLYQMLSHTLLSLSLMRIPSLPLLPP